MVPLYRMAIMPLIFVAWSLVTLYSKQTMAIALWPLFLGVGSWVGYTLIARIGATINKEKLLVSMPGSVVPLLLSISFFLVKYCLGVSYALDPGLKSNILVSAFSSSVSGIISGMSVGRFLNVIQKFRAG